MSLTDSTRTMLLWLRDAAAPVPDSLDASCPLRVLERTRLSEEEVGHVADRLRHADHATAVDVAVEITKVLDALPHPADVNAALRLLSRA